MHPFYSPRSVIALWLVLIVAVADARAADDSAPPTAKVSTELVSKRAPARGSARETKPASKPVAEPNDAPVGKTKPGFLGRLWPGNGKGDRADANVENKEKLGPAKPEESQKMRKPEEGKKPATGKAKAGVPPQSAALASEKPTVEKRASGKPAAEQPAVEKKPSFWARVASAVAPGKSAPGKTSAPAAIPARTPPKVAALDANSSTFVITKDESPFYTFGPNQATPPDAYLSTGTVVTLLEKSWGWAQVQLPDGRTGMMARDALRPATVADLRSSSTPGSLMAAAVPHRPVSSQRYVMPPAAIPELPTVPPAPANSVEAEELSSALLPPFGE
jgi:hypothetical protein